MNGQMKLMNLALCHPSWGGGVGNNQRLEFLGDTVVNLVVCERLYSLHPDWNEGMLSQAKGELVCGRVLAEGARLSGLDKRVRCRCALTDNILGDVFESYVGALFLEEGFESARKWVLEVLGSVIDVTGPYERNYKAKLQHVLQGRGEVPRYRVVGEGGLGHKRVFSMVVDVVRNGGVVRTFGPVDGSSKKDSEVRVAELALKTLGVV